MRKIKKSYVLLLACLLLAAMLAGCASKQCVWCGKSFSGSGHDTGAGTVCDDCYNSLSGGTGTSGRSNTGVWIAVTVMVFIAVFSATSGVVYLVLQKVLPPEKPASRSRRTKDYDYDDFLEPGPAASRPAGSSVPRPSGTGGVWICPRDKSRNSGPYCAVCGAGRPAAPQRAQTDRPAARGAQSQARPGGQGERADARARQPISTPRQQPSAPASRSPEAAPRQNVKKEDWAPVPAPEAPQTEYRGVFMRKESTPEPEVDSELLAAIFREVAENPEE